MPTRKQRRRREKSFRHEYEYVFVDDEGNEVAVDDAPDAGDARSAPAKSVADKGKAATPRRSKGATPTRTGRVVQPASWRRVGKRALIFAPLMFVVVSVLDSSLGPAAHAAQTIFLLAFFLPFSYVMDSIAYRMYMKRTGGSSAEAKPGRRGESKGQPPPRSPR
jgi:hypothetical protein